MTATPSPQAEARTARSLLNGLDDPLDDQLETLHDSTQPRQRPQSSNGFVSRTSASTPTSETQPVYGISSTLADNSTATTLRPAPPPSTKRRESEAALLSPDPIEKSSKKRKRAVSPPWQFPTAENTTLKTADGRRISARVNPSTPGLSDTEGRARSISQSGSKSRPASPPWKKFAADGPTSVNVDGVRKSGRVNRELADLPKRISPSLKKRVDKASVLQRNEHDILPVKRKVGRPRKSSLGIRGLERSDQRPTSSSSAAGPDKRSGIADTQKRLAALQPAHFTSSPADNDHRAHRRTRNTASSHLPATVPPSTPSTRRKRHQLSTSSPSPDSSRTVPRLKLRFNASRHAVLPPHPQASNPSPVRPPRLSVHQVLDNLDLREMQQSFIENNRAPPDREFFTQRAEKQAAEEGSTRQRILKATERGGPLDRENMRLFREDHQPEPPQPYGHHDHVVAHALFLRHLQQREKAHHRAVAKKLAYEAVEYWRVLHGPTEEDVLAEQAKILELIKKQVVADIEAKWRMVETHIREAKKAKWEAEQEVIRAEKLRKKLQWSERLLARQRGEADVDTDLDEDSIGDIRNTDDELLDSSGTESNIDTDNDSIAENMSESESENGSSNGEVEGDMDEEALAAYLAQREDDVSRDHADHGDHVLGISTTISESAESVCHDSEIPLTGAALDDRSRSVQEDESESEFLPAKAAEEDSTTPRNLFIESSQRRMRRNLRESSPISQTKDEAQTEGHLSSDESTNMDSEDYESDEDLSSSDDESDHPSENASSDDDNGESQQRALKARSSLLALYDPKDFARDKDGGLPTPNTSVENGGDNENARSASETQSEDEANVKEPAHDFDATSEQLRSECEMVAGHNSPLEQQHDRHGDNVSRTSETVDLARDQVVNGEAMEVETPSDNNAAKALVPSPSLLRGTLRSYQHAGLDWLASLYRNGTNGILADEMGLGKTIQTIALLAHLAEVHEVWESHLIIVPTSVILNWVTEFQKFLPGFRVLGYYGTSEERHNKRRGWVNDPHHENKEKRGYNVIVTSYNVAMQDINAIRNVQWHYLILDEAHNIRNFNSQRWQILIRLRTRARLLLTGTPLQNNLAEVWSLLTFLTAGDDDSSHGELEEFLGHWKDPVKEIFDKGVQTLSSQAQKVVDQLHISLRPFLLRRKKDEVEKDLPKKTESVVVCKLSKRQRQLYQDYMGLADTRTALAKGSGIQAGAVLLSLRRVCNHPDLFDPRPIETSFVMEQTPLALFSVKERVVLQLLGQPVVIPDQFLIAHNENGRRAVVHRSRKLSASTRLQQELKKIEAEVLDRSADRSTLAGVRVFQQLQRREHKLSSIRACIQITDRSTRDLPLYGVDLRDLLTVRKTQPYRIATRRPPISRALHVWPALGHRPLRLEHCGDWHLLQSSRLQQDVMTLDMYAEKMHDLIVKFAFVPPAVTAPIWDFAIPSRPRETIRASAAYPRTSDFAHEARVRTSIAFPDSRLLIYDSGKLQRLTYLLRELQAKGSRSLIFTQMTGTLNILEQFLNLLNLPYLRLDGGTPVERRQLYAAEFNRADSRYQCMILSSRAGGVGLNLTGASSVIFYDLDWNPQMDRQCMDRAHRIGQVRDVEVFRMVSEKTVEENILRRAEQKSLLDQTVIQDGHFTTEHPTRQRAGADASNDSDDNDGVEAAIERFLGGGEKNATQALESVEDKEDVQAAQQARKEDQQDDLDFAERTSKGPSTATTPAPPDLEAELEDAERQGHVDLYMERYMRHLLEDQPYVPPPARKADKHGRDPGHRPKRKQ